MKKNSFEIIIKKVSEIGKEIEINMISGLKIVSNIDRISFIDDETIEIFCDDGTKWVAIDKIESIYYLI